MKKINDTQDQAIWDAINKEHHTLSTMYDDRITLEERHHNELDDFIERIAKQENKVIELCKGKVKISTNSNNRIILDLTTGL